jgi:mRNA-degrading endonuclease toxin of MazEF toxin-antitoxin module
MVQCLFWPCFIQADKSGMTRGSVWWVEFAPVVGTEIHKTRPAVTVLFRLSVNTLFPIFPLTKAQSFK